MNPFWIPDANMPRESRTARTGSRICQVHVTVCYGVSLVFTALSFLVEWLQAPEAGLSGAGVRNFHGRYYYGNGARMVAGGKKKQGTGRKKRKREKKGRKSKGGGFNTYGSEGPKVMCWWRKKVAK